MLTSKASPVDGSRYTIVHPPAASSSLAATQHLVNKTVLPLELVDSANQVFFLHLLATDPSKVLPPGKSLLSVLSRPRTQHTNEEEPTLEDRVTVAAHKAFWDEARAALSDPLPSIQLARIRGLYKDVHDTINPLVPPNHPVLTTLSFPPSPTSSPLTSTAMHLREVLLALRGRCAPARDASIDALLDTLDNLPPPSDLSALADAIVNTTRDILKLADVMKDDLSQFVLGTMSESDLSAIITTQAKMRERNFVLDHWPIETTRTRWNDWLMSETDGPEGKRWIRKLVQALLANVPVSCVFPGTISPLSTSTSPEQGHTNELPPPFFFDTPSLLYVQNFLQALVIAASLRALTRLSADTGSEFMQRIWALLKAEIDGEPQAEGTKLINLADEVYRARKSVEPTLDADAESKLRDAVDRTLRPNDPVFLLLQKRLAEALSRRLEEEDDRSPDPVVPERMQSGLGAERPGKRPRVGMQAAQVFHTEKGEREAKLLVVKGFEDPMLAREIAQALSKIRGCTCWVRTVWEGVVEFG
ncbi:hypothetical protein PUNSTDRAFT_50628 [Punctularia strigosozonata HHB-11173 SS5]|uniref:uncharacterized protein n=1 Tax=Punctularia strigosozonata (strain HHB-11173) TaxID=741275 RepID=UPI0004417357|nr:uncharacterized protein PUNSTDRAFT_50628 [Punctularia strigosozonata HHB-11173 SS5]EIN11758.1 hypothetical protein PUNSTDRAFT_50628 [Punctularia strigosozonata HHB-11173 SS5]